MIGQSTPATESATGTSTSELPEPAGKPKAPQDTALPKEVGGRDGPEPTRYGDWEKNGRCIDF